MEPSAINRVIFITGCSSGIGLDAALTLSKRGHQVIASCRKADDVKKLITLGLDTILMDVDDSKSIQQGFNELLSKTNGCLDILINNAGYGQVGALEDLSRDILRRQFETNVFGLMELTCLVIPIMRREGHGRIINISSMLGLISLPFRGAYNASKYAVEGLCDTLRLELKPSGIDVICIEPGPIESQFRNNAIQKTSRYLATANSHFQAQYTVMQKEFIKKKADSMFTKSSGAVVNKLIHAIESPSPRAKYPVTVPSYLFIALKRLLSTRLLDRLLAHISRKELGSS